MAYFAASVDTPEENTKFAEHVSADYPILGDPSKDTARAYGVLGTFGVANRWTYYVGVDGRILHIEKSVKVSTAGPDVAAKLADLNIDKR